MSRLTDVHLAASLTKKQAPRLDTGPRRLLHLRLVLGGQPGEHRIDAD